MASPVNGGLEVATEVMNPAVLDLYPRIHWTQAGGTLNASESFFETRV
jgi:hypothetical protein